MIYSISPPNFNALGCLDRILWKGVFRGNTPAVLQRDIKATIVLVGLMAELAIDDDFTEVLFRLMMISILFCKPLKQGGIKF